jgi:hypothetical protein
MRAAALHGANVFNALAAETPLTIAPTAKFCPCPRRIRPATFAFDKFAQKMPRP